MTAYEFCLNRIIDHFTDGSPANMANEWRKLGILQRNRLWGLHADLARFKGHEISINDLIHHEKEFLDIFDNKLPNFERIDPDELLRLARLVTGIYNDYAIGKYRASAWKRLGEPRLAYLFDEYTKIYPEDENNWTRIEEKIDLIEKEYGTDNWDGYGASRIFPETLANARKWIEYFKKKPFKTNLFSYINAGHCNTIFCEFYSLDRYAEIEFTENGMEFRQIFLNWSNE